MLLFHYVIACMGACAAHFKHNKHRESLPSSETCKLNLPVNHSQKIINDIRNTSNVFQMVSAVTQTKDDNILSHNREQFHSIATANKKQTKSKEYHVNERILNWIDEIDRDYPLSSPESMLSLHTLLIREHEAPRCKTNKQEIIERKHHLIYEKRPG